MYEMKFYQIDTNYLNMLRQVDEKVPYNKEFIGRKGKSRPYIGIMLSIDQVDYLVPLSSKKKRSSFVVMPIYDDTEQIATLMLNNMLPVPPKYRELLNMEAVKITDPKYFDFLMNELNFLRPRREVIKARCAVIRAVKAEGQNRKQLNEKTKDFCLNLFELEKIYKENR